MRTVNTEKMDKVIYHGQEIAFGRIQKNEYGEYVVKVYVDGVYDEDKTIYADCREDAEYTKAETIRDYTERNVTLVVAQKYIDMLDGEDKDIATAKVIQELRGMTDAELVTFGYLSYSMLDTEDNETIRTLNSICADILTARENAEYTRKEARA